MSKPAAHCKHMTETLDGPNAESPTLFILSLTANVEGNQLHTLQEQMLHDRAYQ